MTELDELEPMPASPWVDTDKGDEENADVVVEVGVVANTETFTSATGACTIGGGGGV